jgi:RND family efflux transporter MFP subunit
MKPGGTKIVILTLLLFVLAALGWWTTGLLRERSGAGQDRLALRPVPVAVTPIERGSIALKRSFSGEIEAMAEFLVAPKVSGRVEKMGVAIADAVARGQVVAELDNDEYVQAVAQAQADLEVARAKQSEAESALEIAAREFKRTESLLKRGIASDSQFDAVRQERSARQAQLKVAEAQVAKARSSLETANIRLGYTQVTAGWAGGDDYRVVGERYVDAGQTVAANTPLLLIVELDPIAGIIYVTEKDYAYLTPGQHVELTTDAYPGETFVGKILRIAPVFSKSTRQARIEMSIDNPEHRLKPGMFISATVELERLDDAIIVPEQAVTRRADRSGVFIVNEDSSTVAWREVGVGIREGDRVQVTGEGLTGRVVTLGQQMVTDGARISIPQVQQAPQAPPASDGSTGGAR